MGRKNVIHQYNMFKDQTGLNMSGNLTSNITNVEQLDKISIHAKWTAGPVGEFKILARNGGRVSPLGYTTTDDSFYELNFGQTISVTGSDSEIQIVLEETPFTEIRLTYTASSGSAADLTVNLTAKTVGA